MRHRVRSSFCTSKMAITSPTTGLGGGAGSLPIGWLSNSGCRGSEPGATRLMQKKLSHTPSLTRRAFSRAAGGVLLCPSLLANTAATAQDFPGGKGIKLVCGSSPGSVSDIVGRIFAEQLQNELGVTVYVENKIGASGIIAAQSILASPADGHTIYITSGAHTTAPLVNKANYDPVRDFSGAATLAVVRDVLVVSSSSGIQSVADLINAARARPGSSTSRRPASAAHHT
jgi:tripartite-type tricarboxylate transporter receptor subunit TctC